MDKRAVIHPTAREKALEAVRALGRGYDVTLDLKLGYCKGSPQSCLIQLDNQNLHDIVVPGGFSLFNVSKDISCDKGERTRFRSDALSFHEMSERFNQGISINGRMPLGLFNSMFNYNGPWHVDAQTTKSLALDGWFVTLYKMQVTRTSLVLCDEVKQEVPSAWDAAALANFIEKYGTHIVLSVKMGGKDVIYIRQQALSHLSPFEIQKNLKKIGDQRFQDSTESKDILNKEATSASTSKNLVQHLQISKTYDSISFVSKKDIEIIIQRRGGNNFVNAHEDWLTTISSAPEVISMTFVPITSLLNGVLGSGYLSHAINLYMRYKPPIDEIQHFLEFQIPRQWTPGYDLPLGPQRKEPLGPALQFSFLGPKLHISTSQVSVGHRPVTGLRFCLGGKKFNRLSLHLQHLATLPKNLQPYWKTSLSNEAPMWKEPEEQNNRWFEPVQWKGFSHVTTVPVELESHATDTACAYVVIGAQLQVWELETKKVLFLRLLFSKIHGCSVRRSIWDHVPSSLSQKPALFSQLGLSTSMSSNQQAISTPFSQNSAVFPGGPPAPAPNAKLLKFVNITEMTKGAQDLPGHWLVTGAKLDVENGKISLGVKYSLLHY